MYNINLTEREVFKRGILLFRETCMKDTEGKIMLKMMLFANPVGGICEVDIISLGKFI